MKFIVDLGTVAAAWQDATLRDLPCRRIEADEIHSFCYARRKNVPPERAGQFGYGDVWTWVAIDPETKLVVSWLLGDREAGVARAFMRDLASRLSGRIQLTTDGLRKYPDAVEVAFGGDVDYAALVKDFATDKEARSIVHQGNPDPERITTSYIERQNLTMRMGIRRYTRRTNAFSKKIENHGHMLAIHFLYYNFARSHMSLDGITPAQAVLLSLRRWQLADMVDLLESSKVQILET